MNIDGPNYYHYVFNSPLQWVDPNGLETLPEHRTREEQDWLEARVEYYNENGSGQASVIEAENFLGLLGSLRGGAVCGGKYVLNAAGREIKGRAARRAQQQQVRSAARKAGVDEKRLSEEIHKEKQRRGMGGDETFTYDELLDLAEGINKK